MDADEERVVNDVEGLEDAAVALDCLEEAFVQLVLQQDALKVHLPEI